MIILFTILVIYAMGMIWGLTDVYRQRGRALSLESVQATIKHYKECYVCKMPNSFWLTGYHTNHIYGDNVNRLPKIFNYGAPLSHAVFWWIFLAKSPLIFIQERSRLEAIELNRRELEDKSNLKLLEKELNL